MVMPLVEVLALGVIGAEVALLKPVSSSRDRRWAGVLMVGFE